MDDIPSRSLVDDAWTALVHRVAAIVGSLTALVALLCDVPVTSASLRGALAWLAVSILGRATSWLLGRTLDSGPAGAAKPPETS